MACTTILVGKNATYNGSTMISRNDDNPTGSFAVKKFKVVEPHEQPREYHSVISHCTIALPDNPMRYTSVPNVNSEAKGIWAAAGINSANVAMTATETLTTNQRVLAADPLVVYQEATDTTPEQIGGIGEEDIVVLVLPYIHSAREGVKRLGMLLEQYGTYENNGIAFADHDEVWYLETVGGHHWIARKLPDDCYTVIANQFSLDDFDLDDATGEQKEHMASADIVEFINQNHLNLSKGKFNARLAFGSHSDSDHIYNTPRVWYGQRYFNRLDPTWTNDGLLTGPESDVLPWCRKPDYLITVEDVKYVQSSTYQGTPYSVYSNSAQANIYRSIGVNRTSFLGVAEIRNDVPREVSCIQWVAFASNVYNALVPIYTNCTKVPEYIGNTTLQVNTNNFYWSNRLISAIADPHHDTTIVSVERYQEALESACRQVIVEGEKSYQGNSDAIEFCNEQNQKIVDLVQKHTDQLLDEVLFTSSCLMQNRYSRSDN